MPSIRKTKTASGATAIQVVRYRDRKVVVLKHIGSARTPEEIAALEQSAEGWIQQRLNQPSFFEKNDGRILSLSHCSFTGVKYTLAYRALSTIATYCGFDTLKEPLAIDFAIMRIFEPCSKRRSIELLDRFFDIHYAERTLYRALRTVACHKQEVEQLAVSCAKSALSFNCSLVFYDVTTLYFESFQENEDTLRKTGFSKDQKPQQPQIVVGLLVTSQGFPLGYELFKGNTFEGHTMLPVIETFQKAHKITTLTIVADAAMLSFQNIEELKRKNFSYIVGARVANLSPKLIEKISTILNRNDGAICRFPTRHGDLICSFSQERFRKDKYEMERQILKAKKLVQSRESGRRTKFVQTQGTSYALNRALIEKTERLLGIKGYLTNIPRKHMSDKEIIAHYRNLWRVEQTFRMAKSDLEVRPIFHRTDEAIRAHLLICFLALAISKYAEIKSGFSLRKIIDLLKKTGDAIIVDTTSGEKFTISPVISQEIQTVLQRLGVSY